MTVGYKGVGWNRQKKIYDLTVVGGLLLYLGAFIGVGLVCLVIGYFAPLPGRDAAPEEAA